LRYPSAGARRNYEMETLDSIKIRGLEVQVYQAKAGYRFSLDALLLADFPDIKACRSVLELGAGSGVVSLLLAKKYPRAKVFGVEIQDGLYKRAVRNAELNGLSCQVKFMHADFRSFPKSPPLKDFDLVVSNPPFRKPGTGRISPGDERAAARHELKGGINDVVKAASLLLKNRGRLCLVYHPDRLAMLFKQMALHKLEPKRMRMVHSHTGDFARMVLVEAVKEGAPGLKVLPPLFVYSSLNEYTPEMREFYGLPPAP
jgi:tRNA1(Val) A37 N6-methylase TrmN6